jgi:hypothetical protein
MTKRLWEVGRFGKVKKIISFLLVIVAPIAGWPQSAKPTDIFEKTKIDFKVAPKIQLAIKNHDFGVVEEGTQSDFEFNFKNRGKMPLRILGAYPSSNRVSVILPSQEFLTGQEGNILIRYETTGFPGKGEDTIVVKTNDPSTPSLLLKLDISVEREVDIQPEGVRFLKVKKGANADQFVRVLGKPGLDFKILSLSVKGNSVSVKKKLLTEVVPAKEKIVKRKKSYLVSSAGKAEETGVVLTIALSKNLPIGKFSDEIILQTNDLKKPEIHIPVSGEVYGRIQTFPDEVQLSDRYSRSVTLRVVADPAKDFRIEKTHDCGQQGPSQ